MKIIEKDTELTDGQGFLRKKTFAQFDPKTGEAIGMRELVALPSPVLDVIPWFELGGKLFIVLKDGFPRPIINAHGELPFGSGVSSYITEQIGVFVKPASLEPRAINTTIASVLKDGAGLRLAQNTELGARSEYFTAADMLDEKVVAIDFRIEPILARVPEHNYSQFVDSGVVRPIDAIQLLQACQMGHLPDARTEREVYPILLRLGYAPGPWLGSSPVLTNQANCSISPASPKEIFSLEPVQVFRKLEHTTADFFEIRRANFVELDQQGTAVASVCREYAVPAEHTHLSSNRLSVIPVMKTRNKMGEEEILIGVEMRDLPAAQEHLGTARIPAAPVFTLPQKISSLEQAEAFLRDELNEKFGELKVRASWTLGGSYNPSPGMVPGRIQPMLVEVDAESAAAAPLQWISLKELLPYARNLRDAQLITGLFRAAHALGALEDITPYH